MKKHFAGSLGRLTPASHFTARVETDMSWHAFFFDFRHLNLPTPFICYFGKRFPQQAILSGVEVTSESLTLVPGVRFPAREYIQLSLFCPLILLVSQYVSTSIMTFSFLVCITKDWCCITIYLLQAIIRHHTIISSVLMYKDGHITILSI